MEDQERTATPPDPQIPQTPAVASRARRFGIVGSIGLSLLLFFVAIFLPAFNLSTGDTFPAFSAFLMGFLGIFYPPGGFGWYANVFLLITWAALAFSKFRLGLASILVGIGLAFCSMLLKTIMLNEGGKTATITSMGSGFYVWLGSFAVCLAADLAILAPDFLRRRSSPLSGKP